MSEKFGETYYDVYEDEDRSAIRKWARRMLKAYPRPLFELLDREPDGRLLDVGCGTGNLLLRIRELGYRHTLLGVDLGEYEDLPDSIAFTRAPAQDMPFEDGSIRIVTCCQVIEHIPDPYPAIAEMVRVLEPGGWLYVEAPSLRSMLDPFGQNFFDDPTHLRPYTQTALRRLLEHHGLRVEKTAVRRSRTVVALGGPYAVVAPLLGDGASTRIFVENVLGSSVLAVARKA